MTNKTKILVKKAISRKPGHIYYIDRWGNVVESSMQIRKLLPLQKLKCKWIDIKRWFN